MTASHGRATAMCEHHFSPHTELLAKKNNLCKFVNMQHEFAAQKLLEKQKDFAHFYVWLEENSNPLSNHVHLRHHFILG